MQHGGRMKIAFLFSGQGSHYYHMGQELFEQRGSFYRNAVVVDELIRQRLGVSIVAAIYDRRSRASDVFDRTLLTHSAIFLIEYALAKALMSEGVVPDVLVATSMGAFAALTLAGCISVEQAIEVVVTQATLLEQNCVPGGILALPTASSYEAEVLAARFDCEVGLIGKWSASSIAADQERLEAAEAALRNEGVMFQRLAVSRAFHSRWIDAARVPFLASLASVRINLPGIPIICCADIGAVSGIRKAHLWDIVRLPIRFEQAIEALCCREYLRFIDVGPSGTLATSVKYCARHQGLSCEIQTVLSPFGGAVERYRAAIK